MAQSYGYTVKENTPKQKTFKNKYSVELTVDISTAFTIEADSKAQADRVIKKIIEAEGVSENGIREDSFIWRDAEDNMVFKGGLSIRDKSSAKTLTYNASESSYGEFSYDFQKM